MSEPIDLHGHVKDICDLLGIDSTYVAEIKILPDKATVTLFRGKDGHCKGSKFIYPDSGEAAMETMVFEVRA